jgi:hypothetical protein
MPRQCQSMLESNSLGQIGKALGIPGFSCSDLLNFMSSLGKFTLPRKPSTSLHCRLFHWGKLQIPDPTPEANTVHQSLKS